MYAFTQPCTMSPSSSGATRVSSGYTVRNVSQKPLSVTSGPSKSAPLGAYGDQWRGAPSAPVGSSMRRGKRNARYRPVYSTPSWRALRADVTPSRAPSASTTSTRESRLRHCARASASTSSNVGSSARARRAAAAAAAPTNSSRAAAPFAPSVAAASRCAKRAPRPTCAASRFFAWSNEMNELAMRTTATVCALA